MLNDTFLAEPVAFILRVVINVDDTTDVSIEDRCLDQRGG